MNVLDEYSTSTIKSDRSINTGCETLSGPLIIYSKNNILHRDDGPAIIQYYDDGVTILRKIWFRNGVYHRDNNLPSYIIYDEDGMQILKAWYIDGKYNRTDNEDVMYSNFFIPKKT
jgi:hypothetical protein